MDPASKSRQKLFETAARLFYQYGSRAIGVDTIAAESGVGKMTLYRHYPSKDDLLVAFLQAEDEKFWRAFQQATAAAATPRARLVAFLKPWKTGLFAGLLRLPVPGGCRRIPAAGTPRPPGSPQTQAGGLGRLPGPGL